MMLDSVQGCLILFLYAGERTLGEVRFGEVQAAYRGQAMKWHPDHVKEGDKAEANRKFQQLNEAYSVLRDPAKRRLYDVGSP